MITAVVAAVATLAISFVTHASFFSIESGQPAPLDPQVFVAAANAAAGIEPQGIQHAAGFRPAFLSDPPETDLYNADGTRLGFTLKSWLGATGTLEIRPAPGCAQLVMVRFRGLVPRGSYSLFENHFDQQPVGFSPWTVQAAPIHSSPVPTAA